ncbi:MAG: HD-GYP domain-containing protein [Rhodoferax sp.]
MKYVPIPVQLLAIGQPLPVDLWSSQGQLLLRKGQQVVSAQHRERLAAHDASATEGDASAWQRAYERQVHRLLHQGADVREVARAPMPSVIREVDYQVAQRVSGGWLDLQEVLRGILYQGGLSINPLPRLAGIEKKLHSLLKDDTDDSLFCLYQALADDSLGYCATHALLAAVVCELSAEKLGFDALQRQSLMRAALTMNIGMARDQDSLARQDDVPAPWQQTLIQEHPMRGADILRGLGQDDPDVLDMVRWHHEPESTEALPQTLPSRRLLALADSFIAQTAGRKSRPSLSAVRAVKSMVLGAQGDAIGYGSAMAQAVGFYPPGSYVKLQNGEIAVSVERGARANTPWVVSIIDRHGMPTSRYACRETTSTAQAIAHAVQFESVRVNVSVEKVRRARDRIVR